jgi:hypothetical protein
VAAKLDAYTWNYSGRTAGFHVTAAELMRRDHDGD